jgi:hypothetical protein
MTVATDIVVTSSGIGLATAPGPFQLIVPSTPNTGVGLYPTVLIPAFAVPSSILLHVLSLRQLRRASRQGRIGPSRFQPPVQKCCAEIMSVAGIHMWTALVSQGPCSC